MIQFYAVQSPDVVIQLDTSFETGVPRCLFVLLGHSDCAHLAGAPHTYCSVCSLLLHLQFLLWLMYPDVSIMCATPVCRKHACSDVAVRCLAVCPSRRVLHNDLVYSHSTLPCTEMHCVLHSMSNRSRTLSSTNVGTLVLCWSCVLLTGMQWRISAQRV